MKSWCMALVLLLLSWQIRNATKRQGRSYRCFFPANDRTTLETKCADDLVTKIASVSIMLAYTLYFRWEYFYHRWSAILQRRGAICVKCWESNTVSHGDTIQNIVVSMRRFLLIFTYISQCSVKILMTVVQYGTCYLTRWQPLKSAVIDRDHTD